MRQVDLWTLVQTPGYIDEAEVLPAMRRTLAEEPELDYRTRLLIHEALGYLQERVGRPAMIERLSAVEIDLLDNFERECDRGFPSLRHRMVQATTPQQILKLLRDLGRRVRQSAVFVIGGSASLLLSELIVRRTDDIDVVDELPPAIRADHHLINDLDNTYGLRLTHFASHYLPTNWHNRTRSLGMFGSLDVRLVDPIDVLTGKLFSKRQKDFKDLLAASPLIDLDVLRDRLRYNTHDLRADETLRAAAEHNWYVLTGEESLPSRNPLKDDE